MRNNLTAISAPPVKEAMDEVHYWPLKLRMLREHLKMTQEELADIIGVSQRDISYWESGVFFPFDKTIWELVRIWFKNEGLSLPEL